MAADFNGYDEELTECVKVLDKTLGFDDAPIGRNTLRLRAAHIMQNGYTIEDI